MDNRAVLFVEFNMSLVSFVLLAWWYAVPWCRACGFAEAAAPLLLLHTFRHMGLFYLSTSAVPAGIPDGFTQPTAYGDLASAGLALAAVLMVRGGVAGARPVVWLFNTVGLLG